MEDEVPTKSKIIDFTAIENIREVERQTGKQLLPSIFQGYVSQMEEKLRQIEKDAHAEDGVSVFRTAHAIKSMSANIGAEKVKTISVLIEMKGRENVFSGLTDSISILNDAYHEFLAEFDVEFSNENSDEVSALTTSPRN